MAKKSVQLDANGKRKFGMRDCVAYAAGDLGCNMSFALKNTVQTFWLVYVAMDSTLLAALLLAVQIWDAVNDPLIGSFIDADRKTYKRGKFKTYVLVGAIGLLFAGSAVFIPVPAIAEFLGFNPELLAIKPEDGIVNPDYVPYTVIRSVIYVLGYILWDAFYTIANVPYGSMLSLVTEDAAERSSLSTWRSLGAAVGNVIPMIILPMLIWKKEFNEDGTPKINPETDAQVETLLGERVFFVALLMGVIGFVCFIFMIKNLTIRVDESNVKANDSQKFNVVKAFGNFMKNRPAVGATIAAMAMFIGMQSANTATTIMFATYFGQASLSGIVMLVGNAPMFIFMPFIKKLVTKFGKKEASAAGAFVSIIGSLIMMLFPLISNKTISLVVYVAGLSIFGLGLGVYMCVTWALMADAIDYNEWKTGSREEGTVYSLHSFFRKLAQGIGPSIVLVLMGVLGYNEELGTGGQNLQTATNMCWLVAGLYVFSAVVMFVGLKFVYNLDKKTMATMNAELEERRKFNV